LQRSTSLKGQNYEAYIKSGALEKGDDYPWFSELSNNQGGGLSPLNYFYRECVDFVAWRLNRDVGSTSAPFVFDWNYLTPSGGDASNWANAWKQHGWATGTTPKVGSVAWFPGHVAYVSKVNDDGTVFLEEYNYDNDHLYGTRTIPATDVSLYLYAPPLSSN
jgi:surface antigen